MNEKPMNLKEKLAEAQDTVTSLDGKLKVSIAEHKESVKAQKQLIFLAEANVKALEKLIAKVEEVLEK